MSTNTPDDPQQSLTLDPKVIASGFANDGQDSPADGQVASLTSTNNFINFCSTVPNLPITNGASLISGSCNPAPMGVLPSSDNIPSCKFTFPRHLDVLRTNQAFIVELSVLNFNSEPVQANKDKNFLSAPQQLNEDGLIVGYVGIVIQEIDSLDSVEPLDPRVFAFHKSSAPTSFTSPDGTNVIQLSVAQGLPAGTYRLTSLMRTANHAPVLSPILAQGSSNDVVYFTVSASGQANITTSSALPSIATTTGIESGTATQQPDVHQSSRSDGVIAGAVLGSLAGAFILIGGAVFLWKRRRIRRRMITGRSQIQPFPAHEQRSTSTISATIWRQFRRTTIYKGRQQTETDEIPLSSMPSHSLTPQTQEVLSQNGQRVAPVADAATMLMFQEFLESRQRGLNLDEDVPPAYEDLSTAARSVRPLNPVSNRKRR